MTEKYYTTDVLLGTEKVSVPFIPIKELFGFNQKPYFFIGSSGRGKTVLSIDIIHHFAEQANYIYYVSQTKASFGDFNPINQLPKFCVFDPTNRTFEIICDIWNDIKWRSESMKLTVTDASILLNKLYPNVDIQNKYIVPYMEKCKNKYNISGNEYYAVQIEIITRLIIDKIKNSNDTEKQRLSRMLKDDDMKKINALISRSTKSLFILDDVSTAIEAAQYANEKVNYNGNILKLGQAFQNLLNDIITRGRHYNCLCCVFLHNTNMLANNTQKNIDNLVIMDRTTLDLIAAKRIFGMSENLKAIDAQIDIFNPNKYSFYNLYVSITEKNRFAIIKADLHNENVKINDNVKQFYDFLEYIITTENIDKNEIETILTSTDFSDNI